MLGLPGASAESRWTVPPAAESVQSLPQMAGVCQLAFRVPAGATGDSVSLTLEVTRSDATVAVK